MSKKWIKGAVKTKGAFSKALGIPTDDNIPMTLINTIIEAKVGDVIDNPTHSGRRRIKITRKLERQAILAKNLKRVAENR